MPCVIDIRCEPDRIEFVVDVLWQLGTTGVAEITEHGTSRLLAGFENDAATALAVVLDAIGPLVASATVAESIEPTWRTHASPYSVGPFVVRLPEHPSPEGGLDLCIEPGSVFGSGSHATTRLALRSVAGEVARRGPPCAVADIGAGTGVLAVGAAMLGAAPVVAVDIDPDAVATTVANAARNRVIVDARLGSAGGLEGSTFDVVAVNVTLGIQRELAPAVARLLSPGGTLVLAGLLIDQTDEAAGLHPALEVTGRADEEGWSCLELRS